MHLELLWPSVVTIGGVLAGGGATIGIVESARSRSLRSSTLIHRWLTWVIIGSLWLIAIVWPVALAALLVAFSGVAAFEYVRLRQVPILDRFVFLPAALVAVPLVALGVASAVGLVATGLLLATLPAVVTQDVERGPRRAGDLILGFVLVVLPLMLIWELGAGHGPALLLALGLGVAVSDVGAFVCGSTLGSRRVAPRLSPGKTWAGVAGNVVGAAIGVGLAALVVDLPIGVAVLLAAIIGAGALWGDLVESMLKRHRGVKDAGTLLPGFGGLLDRIDSLLIVVPLVYVALDLMGAG